MSEVINVEKKIKMFNIKSVNTECMITIYDDCTILSGLVKKNNECYNVTYPKFSDVNFKDYLLKKIFGKLSGNTIENHEYSDQDCNIIFETKSYIIEKNSIKSIIKIIDNVKLVITAFDDNIFITKIKDNMLIPTFYYSYDNKIDHYSAGLEKYPPSQDDFSQIQKEVFAQHCSDVQKVFNSNVEPVKTNNDGCISQ